MATITGQTLYRYFQQKCSQDYSIFAGGIIKANRLFLDAILAVFEDRFKGVESQKYRDDLNYLINTQKVFAINNNCILEAPLQITYISFQASTATITTYLPHNLIDGDEVTLAGVQGTIVPTINNSFPVLIQSETSFTIPFTWSSGAYTDNTGTVTYDKLIADYWQMVQVSARYDVLYYGLSLLKVTTTTPIQITVDKRTSIRTGTQCRIVQNNSQPDLGDVYVKKLNDFTLELYHDAKFQRPVHGITGWTSGGLIYKVNYKYAKPFLPKTAISPLVNPAPEDPRWKDSEKKLVFFPLDSVCSEITIDYLKTPDVVVDCGNDTIDLTLYYNEKFLLHLVDKAAQIFAMPARDEILYNQSSASLQQNN